MKFKILIIISILLVGIFFVRIFLSDFLINKNEVHIMGEYYVLEINGEYNLMRKEEHGYSLTVFFNDFLYNQQNYQSIYHLQE